MNAGWAARCRVSPGGENVVTSTTAVNGVEATGMCTTVSFPFETTACLTVTT